MDELTEQRFDAHEARIINVEQELRVLTRDFTAMIAELKDLKASSAEIKLSVAGLLQEMNRHVPVMETHIKNVVIEALMEHEKREFANYRSILVWVIGILTTGMASLLWYHFQRLMAHMGQ